MSGFGNRPKDAAPLTKAGLVDAIDRQLAELDRLAALPAGHPDILRALGCNEPVPVPKESCAEMREAVAQIREGLDANFRQSPIGRRLERPGRP